MGALPNIAVIWLERLAGLLHINDSDWFRQFIALVKSIFNDAPGPGTFYHYGCPNSKRTAKLQLKKKSFK